MKLIITFVITLFTLITYSQNTNDVIKYVNLARTNPKTFRDSVVVYYNDVKSKFDARNKMISNTSIKVTRTNTKSNFDSIYLKDIKELIDILEKTKPTTGLTYNKQLDSSLTTHKGITHDDVFNRVTKYIKSDYIAENISYDEKDPMKSVIELMVDFDNPNKGHRKTILDTNFTKIAVSYIDFGVYIQEFCK